MPLRSLFVSALALAMSAPAGAELITWQMSATGAQVRNGGNPDGSTDSTATGTALVTYDSVTEAMTWDFFWEDLEGLLEGLHVQGPADASQSNPRRLWDLFPEESDVIGSGAGRTTGGWLGSADIDRLVEDTSAPPADPGVVLSYMLQDRAYLNIETTLWPDGEIRASFVRISGDLPDTPAQAKCSGTNDKSLSKVSQKRSKQLRNCVSKAAKGKLSGTVEGCVGAALPKSLANTVAKAQSSFVRRCHGLDLEGIPIFPFFGTSEPEVLTDAALDEGALLLRGLFGADLDVAIQTGDLGKCQLAGLGRAQGCQQVALKEFGACKKNGLRGGRTSKLYPGAEDPFDDASDVEGCFGFDRTGKLAKACVDKLRKKVENSCTGVDLTAAFPPLAAADIATLAARIRTAVDCRLCRMLDAADQLALDCELLDDAMDNGSCPAG